MHRPSWVAGAWDWHCHTAPCQLARWGTGARVAREAATAGFAGVVLQTHVESTTGRAATAAAMQSHVDVLGGLTLNESACGGLNAKAVRGQIACGAAFVWFPTFDAAAHVEALGGPGRSLSGVHDPFDTTSGISIVASDGALTASAVDVLDAVADHPVFVGTGHLSLREVTALVHATSTRAIPTVINHPYFLIHPASGWWKDLPDQVIVELAAIADSTNPRLPPIDRILQVIELLGPDRCVIGSETKMINPVDAIVTFGQQLLARGLDEDALRTMLTHSPRSRLARDGHHHPARLASSREDLAT